MTSNATEERTNRQSGDEADEQQENGQSESGARKALKIGALAAAAGTAAYAASKAMTPSESEDDGKSKNGGGGGSSRTSMDQIVSAIGNSRWDVLRDLVVPFAESGARSAGTYIATEAPDFLSDTLVPKFIEGFVEAKGKKITSSD
jgi:hypothetical protein